MSAPVLVETAIHLESGLQARDVTADDVGSRVVFPVELETTTSAPFAVADLLPSGDLAVFGPVFVTGTGVHVDGVRSVKNEKSW